MLSSACSFHSVSQIQDENEAKSLQIQLEHGQNRLLLMKSTVQVDAPTPQSFEKAARLPSFDEIGSACVASVVKMSRKHSQSHSSLSFGVWLWKGGWINYQSRNIRVGDLSSVC